MPEILNLNSLKKNFKNSNLEGNVSVDGLVDNWIVAHDSGLGLSF